MIYLAAFKTHYALRLAIAPEFFIVLICAYFMFALDCLSKYVCMYNNDNNSKDSDKEIYKGPSLSSTSYSRPSKFCYTALSVTHFPVCQIQVPQFSLSVVCPLPSYGVRGAL